MASHLQLLRWGSGFQPTLNLSTREELLKTAYISPPQTPFVGVSKLPGGTSAHWSQAAGITFSPLKTSAPPPVEMDEWPLHFWETFKAATQRLFQCGYKTVALSGGSDSRLVAAALSLEQRAEALAYTKNPTHLSPSEDADLLIAEQVAQRLNIKHRHVLRSADYKKFLVPEFETTPVLTGLYGGELLGGRLADLLPIELSLPDNERAWTAMTIASLSSARTLFYRKTGLSWASPYSMHSLGWSSFLEHDVLSIICALPISLRKNYGALKHIWNLPELRELAKIPFQSTLTAFQDFNKPNQFMINPKDGTEGALDLQISVDKNLQFFNRLAASDISAPLEF